VPSPPPPGNFAELPKITPDGHPYGYGAAPGRGG